MNVIIREAQAADAAQMIAYVQRLAEEPGADIALSPGEFNLTVEQEQKFFADMAAAQNSIFLVAEAGGQIIGNLTCQGGPRQATRHVTALGMSVAREWRDQGVGSQLMRRAIEWARASQVVKRIELNVFARNQRAIHLYEKFGFAIEGSRRSAIYRDGEYLDDYVMGLLI